MELDFKIKYGTTRTTVLFHRWAFKFPAMTEWRLFLGGLLGNMHEKSFSSLKELPLCPIIWSCPGGWLNIMPRCEIITEGDKRFECLDTFKKELLNLNETNQQIVKNIVEFKLDSVGWLNGKAVAVDYGS